MFITHYGIIGLLRMIHIYQTSQSFTYTKHTKMCTPTQTTQVQYTLYPSGENHILFCHLYKITESGINSLKNAYKSVLIRRKENVKGTFIYGMNPWSSALWRVLLSAFGDTWRSLLPGDWCCRSWCRASNLPVSISSRCSAVENSSPWRRTVSHVPPCSGCVSQLVAECCHSFSSC